MGSLGDVAASPHPIGLGVGEFKDEFARDASGAGDVFDLFDRSRPLLDAGDARVLPVSAEFGHDPVNRVPVNLGGQADIVVEFVGDDAELFNDVALLAAAGFAPPHHGMPDLGRSHRRDGLRVPDGFPSTPCTA
jgi:hypothetical protein